MPVPENTGEIISAATMAKAGGGSGFAAGIYALIDFLRKNKKMQVIHTQIGDLQKANEDQRVTLARLEERQVTKNDLLILGTEISKSIAAANAPLIVRIDDLYKMQNNDRRGL